MRCIRLTNCAKTKLRKITDGVVMVIAAIVIILGVMLILTAFIGIIGLITQAIAVALTGTITGVGINIMDAAAVALLTLFLTAAGGYLLYLLLGVSLLIIIALYNGSKSVIEASIGIKPFECKIFEWCD